MITLSAFGDPQVTREDGVALVGFMRQTKRFALLIYLACHQHRGFHSREEIIAMFWPEADPDRGRNALRQSLHVLRRELDPQVIGTNGTQDLWLSRNHVRSDVEAFLDALAVDDLEYALTFYTADFLNGFHVPEAEGFSFWVEQRREQLKETAVRAAQNLAHRAEGERDLPAALLWWKRALDLSRYHEGFVRRVVTLLAGSGNRGAAKAEFDTFHQRLRSELGVAPSLDTMDAVRLALEGHLDESHMWRGDRRKNGQPAAGPHWRRQADR